MENERETKVSRGEEGQRGKVRAEERPRARE